ncbi:hypothetical protein KI387_020664, partial [Taxus chinensis]
VSDHLADAILYLDAGSAEAFQFVGGLPVLLDLGARVVCSLEQALPLDVAVDWYDMSKEPVQKMVVVTSHLLSDAHRYILRCLDMHRSIRHCTIFTSISENAHSACVDAPLGPDAFQEYESLLLQDYHELVLKSNVPQGYGKTDDFGRSAQTPQAFQKSITMKKEDWLETDSSKDAVFGLEASSARTSLDTPSPSRLPPVSNGLTSDGDNIPTGATLIAHFLHHLAGQRPSVDFKVPLEMIYNPGNPLSNGDYFSREGLADIYVWLGWNF